MSVISGIDHQSNSAIASERKEGQLVQAEKLSLSGMHCAACVQLIEFRVRQLPGINLFKINTATHKAEVVWQTEKTILKASFLRLSSLGTVRYQLHNHLTSLKRKKTSWLCGVYLSLVLP